MKNKLLLIVFTILSFNSFAQEANEAKFSQPLYLDLPGDLNVKKGYKELNSLKAFQSYKEYNYYRLSFEYAFAPLNNLGLEVEVPTNLYSKKEHTAEVENKIEAIRIGGMYSIPNINLKNTAVAVGFVNDFEFNSFEHFGKPLFEANALNPFIVLAKVWANRFSTLIYAGPNFHTTYDNNHTKTDLRINTTVGYRFGKKRNFVNIESNQIVYKGKWETILRPQVRLFLSNQWALGIGTTLPMQDNLEGAGGFVRIILNPKNSQQLNSKK